MKAKLVSLPDFDVKNGESDCVWLLTEIKGITYRFEGQRFPFISLDLATTSFFNYRQGPDELLADYFHNFRAIVDVLDHYGFQFGTATTLLDCIKNMTDKLMNDKKIAARSRDRILALHFLKRADQRCFGALWVELENQYMRGTDQYPLDATAVYSLLINVCMTRPPPHACPNNTSNPPTPGSSNVALTFAQASSSPVPGSNGVVHAHITCYQCNAKGHYASACPSGSGVQMLHVTSVEPALNTPSNFTFVQPTHAIIPDTWILLDSQSTVSVFRNPRLLSNIGPSGHSLTVPTNGSQQISTLVGHLANFGHVWFNPNSLANILLLAAVRKLRHITMDLAIEAALCVHRPDGTIMKFQEYSFGLYYFDTAEPPCSFLTIVAHNKSLFHCREVAGADEALALYRKLGRPSQRNFEHLLTKKLLLNCLVTVADAQRARIIYRPEVGTLQGKTTHGGNSQVPNVPIVPVPRNILEHHGNVTLCMDIFYVQGLPFFHTISRKLQFRTIAPIHNRQKQTLLKEALAILNLYHQQDFKVCHILQTPNLNACDRSSYLQFSMSPQPMIT